MGIRQWLGLAEPKDDDDGADAVRRIVERLEALPPEQARLVAAFAYLLGRVANADLDFRPEEVAEMERLVQEAGGLDAGQAVLAVQMAKQQNQLFGGTENFLVARQFRQLADAAVKQRLLRCLFAVAAADGSISAVEDNEISRIAGELGVEPGQLAALRAEFRDRLAVLNSPPSG
ncbi:MAG: hypothetical protein DRI34_02785 [Deltaproteobacteria bacterium]|nr:MAG: hypothetical protein DRI34_02785 [Deltaproteobacteria bacterium]